MAEMTENFTQNESSTLSKDRGEKVFQAITLGFLPFLWTGFFYSLYMGNESNVSHYSLMILMFSLPNLDALIRGKRLSSKPLDALAKLDSALIVVWAAANIVLLLLK